ncbi:MAG TPA: DUF3383 family protein [Anaerovoracaceae bacterium]|nr:DUF3383 family protein [Anaerovoracaceae bacterium]
MKDFVVNITKQTTAISQQGFGLPLILGMDKEHEYTEYTSIDSVSEDFSETTKEYKIASKLFGQSPAPATIAIYSIDSDDLGEESTLVTALNELVDENNDWYFLTCTDNDEETVEALAEWTDAQMKAYFVTTQNLKLTEEMENENTVVFYHDDKDDYVAEGLVAIGAVNDPGSITFKFKTVNGSKAAEISVTELTQLHKDGGNSYIRKMGVLQTTEGKTTSGEYIDVVMGVHWLQARMEEELMYLAVNNKKIPYSNEGIAMLIGVVTSVLQRGADRGIILKDEDGKAVYELDYLKREDVPANDVANRKYNHLKWTAKLEGAIHTSTISGTVLY